MIATRVAYDHVSEIQYLLPPRSSSAQDEMHAAVGRYDVADLAHREGVRSLFERPLHLAWAEPPEVAAVLVRRAVRVLLSERRELLWVPVNLRIVLVQQRDGLFLRARNFWLRIVIFSTRFMDE